MIQKILFLTLVNILFIVCVNAQSTILVYTYDDAGNILSRKIQPTTARKANEEKKDSTTISKKEKHEVNVYPNPTNNILNIEINGVVMDTTWSYQVVDVKGVQHASENLTNNKKTLELSSWPTGIYFLVTNVKREIKRFKIIKE